MAATRDYWDLKSLFYMGLVLGAKKVSNAA
jgi:hypothetical protein